MVVGAWIHVVAWAADSADDPWGGLPHLAENTWERFLRRADRVLVGSVRTVRVVPDPRFHTLTEIVVEVDELVMGSVTGDTVTVILPYDGTRPGPHLVAAPGVGEDMIFTLSPWVRDPARLQLHRYYGSHVLEDGRLVMVDQFRDFVDAVDCTVGPLMVDDESLVTPPGFPRAPWAGPDPRLIAARESAAIDWITAQSQFLSCLQAHLGAQ